MRFPDHDPGRQQRWLALAVTLVLQAHVAFADSVSSPGFDAEAHAKVCRCGSHCRQASCCCGRLSAAVHDDGAAQPTATPHADSSRSAPCLEQAPCGESGFPPTSGPRWDDKAGSLGQYACAQRALGDRLPAHSHLLRTPSVASLTDSEASPNRPSGLTGLSFLMM